jgi:hypothetical protein
MPTEHILSLLVQERDRLNRAIEALQGSAKRVGRPPKNPNASGGESSGGGAPKKRKPFSAAVRKKMALAQKKRWAALKAAK